MELRLAGKENIMIAVARAFLVFFGTRMGRNRHVATHLLVVRLTLTVWQAYNLTTGLKCFTNTYLGGM